MAEKRPRQTDLPSGVRRRQRLRQRSPSAPPPRRRRPRPRRRRPRRGRPDRGRLRRRGRLSLQLLAVDRSGRSRSARTPSSTPPTGRCSARSPPSGTASPCPYTRSARGCAKATIAIEDRRFYEHGGVDYEGIARALLERHPCRQGRRGRLDDHAAARPQPLHRPRADAEAEDQGGLPRDQALARLVEGQDPRRRI